MARTPPERERLDVVEQGFRSLPERYLGADPGFDATYHIKLCDLGHTWEVRCTQPRRARAQGRHAPRARRDDHDRRRHVDARCARASSRGSRRSSAGCSSVRGNLDYAVAFEGMFRLPGGRPPLLQIHDVPVGRHRISTLTMGRGPDVLLLHGLGGTRASLFETAAELSRRYRVHAPDLPGFGSSSKPALGALQRAAGSPRSCSG